MNVLLSNAHPSRLTLSMDGIIRSVHDIVLVLLEQPSAFPAALSSADSILPSPPHPLPGQAGEALMDSRWLLFELQVQNCIISEGKAPEVELWHDT